MNGATVIKPRHIVKRALPRRTFLRSAATFLALPALDAMVPAVARARDALPPRRMLAICNNLGLVPEQFFPPVQDRQQDRQPEVQVDYPVSPYLELLARHRQDFTLLDGVSHPEVDGGHPADICFLTAAPHPGRGGFRNTISIDQHAAQFIGHLTRFHSLSLGVNVAQGSRGLSWTGSGVLIPCEEKPSLIFQRLFMQGTPEEIAAQERRLDLGQSILDSVADQAKALQGRVGPRDWQRVDQFFTGVRELESRMTMQKAWEKKPKPVVTAKQPVDSAGPVAYFEKVRLMYDMARLAFETDSTRLVTLMLDSVNSPTVEIDGVRTLDGYHNLSHHGKTTEKLDQLQALDRAHMKSLDRLFTDLKQVKEGGRSLLDSTMVLYGSNLGNANTHVTTNLPVLFAGGGFKHGRRLAFSREHNYPLSNLFVSMLQRLGIETDRFSTGIATMRGIEPVGQS